MANFPASGGGPSAGPGLNTYLQYCSPSGSDSSDGLTWQSAKKTFDAAMANVHAKGGGEIHFASNTIGNIWMRDDGLTVPGFYTSVPLRVVGHGAGFSSFGEPCAVLKGGTTADRQHPQIWVTASGSKPFVLENMIPFGGITNQIFRSWDYSRKADGSINWLNITTWNRTHANTGDWQNPIGDGRATVTVALPPAINISTIQRSSGVTRVTFPSQAPVAPPVFSPGSGSTKASWVKIASTSGSFPSGDFQVTDTDGLSFFEYADPGVDAGPVSSAGTWKGTGIGVDDRIEIISTQQANLPSTMFKVLSISAADVFVVRDDYGNQNRLPSGLFPATGTFSACGTLVRQNRASAVGLITLRNVQGGSSALTQDAFVNGPTIDFGGSTDGRIRLENVSPSGMFDFTIGCVDPDRTCWLLVDPGCTGAGGMIVDVGRPAAGGMRLYGSNVSTWGYIAKEVQGDNSVNLSVHSPPAMEILNGNSSGFVYADHVWTADARNDDPAVVIDPNMSEADVRIDNCGLVDGPGVVTGGSTNTAWGVLTEVPQVKGQSGFWVKNRLSGRTNDGFRILGGVSSARYLNKVSATGSWTLNGATLTAGQADPFGGTGAIKLTGSEVNVIVYELSQTVADGDRWIFSAWVRRVGGIQPGPNGVVIGITHGTASTYPAFEGDGEWQFLTFTTKIVGSGTVDQSAFFGIASELFIFEPTLIKIPATDGVTANEFAEFVETIRSQPAYLPAGMSGTSSGRKFIAHGGIGTNSANAKTVGVDSGQLTLTGSGTVYLPMYDADGTTIIGWVAQLQATVNP